ncbi:MAG: polysaccharide biosynthesis/export family protein [Flavobacteriaceae bacterium]|nr:polysaccharide biosynthesis/export family protein [Flavobacteriaceae bacterium]
MNKPLIYFTLLILLSTVSCIPTKRLAYLQQDSKDTEADFTITKKPDPYRIQVNDLLSIRIKSLDQSEVGMFNPIGDENPNATGEERLYYDGFLVDAHGNIRMPTLGEVNVLGYTVDEIREKLEKELLENYFKEEANIFVTVKIAGIRYTINGEIGSPGSKIIYRDELTLMEAIANSGDITLTGDRRDVVIVRQYPYGQRVHHIDLTTIEAVNSPYYYVKPNDLILINPLPQKSFGSGTTAIQSITTIASILSLLTTTILLFNRL